MQSTAETDIGAHFGIRTRQGMRDHLDRLDALVETGTPDEQHTRGTRREARERPAHQRWLDQHCDEVTAAIARLVRQLDRVLPSPATREPDLDDDEQEPADGNVDDELGWVYELRLEVDRGELTTGTMGVLGLALGELRVHAVVRELDRGHGVHRALREAERVRAQYDQARGLTRGDG